MKKKYTEDDYKKKCDDFGLLYIGFHSGGKEGKMVDFICPKHEDKGIQSIGWNHFRTYAHGCPYCSGRYKTNADFKEALEAKDIKLISEYKRCDDPVTLKCKKCGNIWKARITDVLRKGRGGCPACSLKRKAEKRRKSQEQFELDLFAVNPDIEVLGEYLGTHKKIKCRCKICGTIWEAYPANLLSLIAGCPRCNMSNGEKAMLDALSELGVPYIPQYPIQDGVHKHPLRYDAYDEVDNIAFEYNGEQHYYPIDFAGKGKEWAQEQFEIAQERDKSKIKYSEEHNTPVIIIPYWEKNNIKEIIINELKEMNLELVS